MIEKIEPKVTDKIGGSSLMIYTAIFTSMLPPALISQIAKYTLFI